MEVNFVKNFLNLLANLTMVVLWHLIY